MGGNWLLWVVARVSGSMIPRRGPGLRIREGLVTGGEWKSKLYPEVSGDMSHQSPRANTQKRVGGCSPQIPCANVETMRPRCSGASGQSLGCSEWTEAHSASTQDLCDGQKSCEAGILSPNHLPSWRAATICVPAGPPPPAVWRCWSHMAPAGAWDQESIFAVLDQSGLDL